MTYYVHTHSGSAIACNPYSTEAERKEIENFRNIERNAAYELRKMGHSQPIIWRQK